MMIGHSKKKDKSEISLVFYNEESKETKRGWQWTYTVREWIFCYLAAVLPLHCFCLSLGAEINWCYFFLGAAVFLMLQLIGRVLTRKVKVAYQLSLYTIVAVLIYWQRDLIIDGFYVLENLFLQRCEERFDITTWRYVVKQEPVHSLTALFIVGAVFFVVITTQELLYFFCVIVLTSCILATGNVPEMSSFIGVLFIYFTMIGKNVVPNFFVFSKEGVTEDEEGPYAKRLRMRIAVYGSVIFLFLYLLLSLCLSKETYQAKGWMDRPKSFFREKYIEIASKTKSTKLLDDLNLKFKKVASGGISGGMLGGVDQISFDGSTHLYVVADHKTDFLYLKGYAGTFYAGDQWIKLSKGMREEYETLQTQFSDSTYSAEILAYETIKEMQQQGLLPSGFRCCPICVSYKNASPKYLYAPYFNDFKTCSVKDSCDLYYYPATQKDYYYFGSVFTSNDRTFQGINDEVEFILSSARKENRESLAFRQFEQAYRAYVYKYYRLLPKTGLSQLKKVCFVSSKEGVEKTWDLVSQVISYLYDHTEYSLSPGATPEGKDFAENFLFHTHKGYCAHYATAAVLLLRNSGVPARYCEGYLVSKDDFNYQTGEDMKQVLVTDRSAHAWIEVYYDGIGWLPAEVTKEYSASLLDDTKNEASQMPPKKNASGRPAVTVPPFKMPDASLDRDQKELEVPQSHVKMDDTVQMLCFGMVSLICAWSVLHHLSKQRKIKKQLDAEDKRVQVATYFLLMEQIFARFHVIRESTMGDYEYMKCVQERIHWLPDSYQQVVPIVLTTCYGEQEPLRSEVLAVKECYEEILCHFLSSKPAIFRVFIKYRYNLVK